jgi:ribosomal protein S18 acetylase RimI-like enzyme
MSNIPNWMNDMEQACFGKAWVFVSENEYIWAKPFICFARWRVSPSIREAELLRIGVAINLRRNGHGRDVLQHSQIQIANFGIQTLLLEVRASNIAARLLYESEGWSYSGLRRRYYSDGEDAANYRYNVS